MTTAARKAQPPVLTAGFVGLAVVLAVLVGGLFIAADPAWSVAEVRIVSAVGSADSPLLDGVATLIDAVMGPLGAPFIALALVVWARFATRTWRGAARAALLLGVPWAVAEAIKLIVRRPRPEPGSLTRMIVPDPFTYSFPSGHTAFTAALVCAVVLTLAAVRARTVAAIVGGALVVLVAWSRVYLGVHYPTDTIAAIVVAVAVAVPLNLLITRHGPLRARTAVTAR